MRIGNPNMMVAGFRRARPLARLGLAAACLMLGAGCRKDMYDQPKYEAYEPSRSFADGTSSRPIVAGTVARGESRSDDHYFTGKVDGKEVDTFPFAVDAAMLEKGRERFGIYCTPCHGRTGDGRGMVVRRGFSPPPTFHSQYLREIPVGHFFTVITNGYGAMYSYAARIPVEDRWAIAAYIRVLQYSQNAQPGDLPEAERAKLAEVSK
jgi:mono/diheme cytochrome c family protein